MYNSFNMVTCVNIKILIFFLILDFERKCFKNVFVKVKQAIVGLFVSCTPELNTYIQLFILELN